MEWFKFIFMSDDKKDKEISFYAPTQSEAYRIAQIYAKDYNYSDYAMIPKTQGKWNYSKEIGESLKK